MLKKKLQGIYHCASSDTTTPFKLINEIIEAKYCVKDAVKSMSIFDFMKNNNNYYRYPIYGGLNTLYSQQRLKMKFLRCSQIIKKLIQQGISPSNIL